jgi:hypothetical protein
MPRRFDLSGHANSEQRAEVGRQRSRTRSATGSAIHFVCVSDVAALGTWSTRVGRRVRDNAPYPLISVPTIRVYPRYPRKKWIGIRLHWRFNFSVPQNLHYLRSLL